MNEAEAKTKWCPEARVGAVYQGGTGGLSVAAINRDQRGPNPDAMCLGHGCMMFVPDREAFEAAMYAYEESRFLGDGNNVVALKPAGAEAPPPPQGSKLKEPDIRDFYKCGKVFPDIV